VTPREQGDFGDSPPAQPKDKGKARKRYEFGVKAGIAVRRKQGLITGQGL
jgi:hypothetical protein